MAQRVHSMARRNPVQHGGLLFGATSTGGRAVWLQSDTVIGLQFLDFYHHFGGYSVGGTVSLRRGTLTRSYVICLQGGGFRRTRASSTLHKTCWMPTSHTTLTQGQQRLSAPADACLMP